MSSVGLVQHPLFYLLLCHCCISAQLSLFCHMIYALANRSKSQPGKDVFSTIARCQGQGWWFRACGSAAAVKGGRGSSLTRFALIRFSGEREGPEGSGKIFLFFKVYFSMRRGMEGCWCSGFNWTWWIKTSWKINTQSLTHSLSSSL